MPQLLSKAVSALQSPTERRRLLEIRRLRRLPRQQLAVTPLLGFPMTVADPASFLSQYRPIYLQGMLGFPVRPDVQRPRIIDCGANVGTSVLWFAENYPLAEIVAFEADPGLFDLLQANCRAAGRRCDLRQQAVWTEPGTISFASDGKDGGRLVGSGSQSDVGTTEVPTMRLRDLLMEAPVEMLKIDIEGAEEAVLLDCADALGEVQNMCIEYHSFNDRPQRLPELLEVMRDSGFRVHIISEGIARQPLLEPMRHGGMDNQLNVFASRSM